MTKILQLKISPTAAASPENNTYVPCAATVYTRAKLVLPGRNASWIKAEKKSTRRRGSLCEATGPLTQKESQWNFLKIDLHCCVQSRRRGFIDASFPDSLPQSASSNTCFYLNVNLAFLLLYSTTIAIYFTWYREKRTTPRAQHRIHCPNREISFTVKRTPTTPE